MTQPRIRLVTRGDDAGSCRSADLAVLEAREKGILRNVSVMVPGPTFLHAAEMLAARPDICVGLHVTLNAEWDSVKWGPVLPARKVPSLVDAAGHFFSSTQALHEHGASAEEMIAEVQAQLDLARSKGLKVSYIDEHMGVGWVAGLTERISQLARREGLIESRVAVRGLPRVEGEFSDLTEALIARLAAAPPGTYLFVTHPGYDAEDMRRLTHPGLEVGQVARQRDADRRVWTDPKVLDFCRGNSVQPIRYTEIGQ